MTRAIVILEDQGGGKIAASVDYGTGGYNDKSGAHLIAARIMRLAVSQSEGTPVLISPDGAQLEGAKVSDVDESQVVHTLGRAAELPRERQELKPGDVGDLGKVLG